ncbi:alpha/beta hydrolase [Aquisalimonas lutea]|uniref:alpha/beta fold hydrolase n=1 Tax=Aquisalimonas lutea TaxID=1327750 RepID=UPI0025B38E6F|nr:alpha/beta hydrolase [Aquisalimonas lutea]MDN3516157.1 alpha/beta hydrolase [Aquisalimonas lutea]
MADSAAYLPAVPAAAEDVNLRGVRHRLHRWGPREGRPLVLLHGWMDTGRTWQFVVDALAAQRHVVALDWRGFGDSDWVADGYYFPDYLADLEALLDREVGDDAVDLVGHSMGGNVAGLYAGIRPRRIRRLALVEGFGTRARDPAEAPDNYARWLDQWRSPPTLQAPESPEAFADRLRERHPHLPADRALFVAQCWLRAAAGGMWQLRGDPAHKRTNPVLYRLEEAEACWRRIQAPVLWVVGSASGALSAFDGEAEVERRRSVIGAERVVIDDAGHMIHHDQPQALAAVLESFLG